MLSNSLQNCLKYTVGLLCLLTTCDCANVNGLYSIYYVNQPDLPEFVQFKPLYRRKDSLEDCIWTCFRDALCSKTISIAFFESTRTCVKVPNLSEGQKFIYTESDNPNLDLFIRVALYVEPGYKWSQKSEEHIFSTNGNCFHDFAPSGGAMKNETLVQDLFTLPEQYTVWTEYNPSHQAMIICEYDESICHVQRMFDKEWVDTPELTSVINFHSLSLKVWNEASGTFWLLCGKDENGGIQDKTFIYSMASNSFSPGPDLPVPLYSCGVTAISNEEYLIHGGIDASNVFTDASYVYNKLADTWTQVGNLPNQTYGSVETLYERSGKKGVLRAGNYPFMDGVFWYDIDAKTWTQIGILPGVMTGGLATVNNLVYFYATREDEQINEHYVTYEMHDLGTELQWTVVPGVAACSNNLFPTTYDLHYIEKIKV